jgi:hypothetical protein
MTIDLRLQDIRISIERVTEDVLDVAPFLAGDKIVELARSEPSPDMPCVSGARFTLYKAYNGSSLSESFDKKLNERFRPGKKVTIEIYEEGQWRSPPFAATTYIKFAFYRDTGTHEELEIETQGKLAQVIEEDKAFDPERKYDAQGNEVPVTRDVLGTTRPLADIINSYLHVKAVGAVVNASGFMTQTTNTYKEYLADSSDSEINFAQQLVWYNPDRASELNFLYENQTGEAAIASIPLDLAIVTTPKRLLNLTWGLYTNDLLTYEPERNVDQLAEFIEVRGVASRAQQRPSTVTDGGMPPQSNSFSLNVPVNPITDTLTTTTFNWAGLTIEIDAKTYSTAEAIKVSSGASVGFGNTLVQQEVAKKHFDARRRLVREEVKRYVPDALKKGTGSSSSIGAPAYQKETLYNLSNTDKVLGQITHETAANAITGNAGDLEALGIQQSNGRNYNALGQGVNIASGGSVASPSLAQGAVPYFPSSFGGQDERANPPQCEYFPEQFYVEATPVSRKVQITWGAGTATGRTSSIDVGNALLTGENFDLLANSLARLHTAKHEQHNCSFPLTTNLFNDWRVPGKIISVLESRKGKRHHYFTGADAIEISRDSVICKTTLFWIGTTDEATGTPITPPAVTPLTQYLIDNNGAILTTETGDRLIWS